MGVVTIVRWGYKPTHVTRKAPRPISLHVWRSYAPHFLHQSWIFTSPRRSLLSGWYSHVLQKVRLPKHFIQGPFGKDLGRWLGHHLSSLPVQRGEQTPLLVHQPMGKRTSMKALHTRFSWQTPGYFHENGTTPNGWFVSWKLPISNYEIVGKLQVAPEGSPFHRTYF